MKYDDHQIKKSIFGRLWVSLHNWFCTGLHAPYVASCEKCKYFNECLFAMQNIICPG